MRDDLPIDPDIEVEDADVEDASVEDARVEDAGTDDAGVSAPARARWPVIPLDLVAAVFVGGVFGGLARYVIGRAAPPPADGFPWDILVINLSGAFALAVLVVVVGEVLPPTRYVRPVLGTGFLGAYTTFSSLATATDHLAAHGRPGLAAGYLLASVFGGLACAFAGLICGRAIGARRRRTRDRTT